MPANSSPPPGPGRRELTVEELEQGVRGGDRGVLGRAISLVESQRSDHRDLAASLLSRLLPLTGKAHRIGLSGVPGVGKSTFIETLGRRLLDQGRRVAVLAVDPSSPVSGGSILGDKTRMMLLAGDPRAFVRPSPSSGATGGVGRRTREAILLCEAAGFDVVFVETVGVGQSETVVADMVDTFVLLLIPGAGDQLQGIKRGILEVADVIAINKADGPQRALAQIAQGEYRSALQLLRGGDPGGVPAVLSCSALENVGLDELWAAVVDHRERLTASGALAEKRGQQQ
ncbi:MAG: methylmalonyl Co-A mutase-associated GTPase MeaB, partial [Planctomycetota bacterium]